MPLSRFVPSPQHASLFGLVHLVVAARSTFAGTTRRVGGPVTKPDDLIRLYEAGVASAAA